MNSFGLDSQARMRIARDHAEGLREAWRSANGRSEARRAESLEPCGERPYRPFATLVASLFADLHLQPRRTTPNPCA